MTCKTRDFLWPPNSLLPRNPFICGSKCVFFASYVDAFLAAALTRVMRAAVPIPAVAAASVLHFAAVGGSVVGVVRPL